MSTANADVRTGSKWLDRELWFAERIAKATGQGLCGLFAGTTDPPTRAARARELILEHRLAARRVIPNRPDTFGDCFTRLYGEPLSAESPEPDLSPKQLEVAL